jgi:uncharacterized protein (TIGR03790 family)
MIDHIHPRIRGYRPPLISLFLAVYVCCCAGLTASFGASPVPASTSELAAHLLVVYNSEFSGSKDLAEEYMALRGIPEERLFGVKGGIKEEISRSDFERFIRAPLLKHVQEQGWLIAQLNDEGKPMTVRNDIWILVLMRGVPLRIGGTPLPGGLSNTERVKQGTVAAVDSELACLPLFDYPLRGALNNPFFKKEESINGRTALRMLIVCRLDAPEHEQVQRMMNDAVTVEKHGLCGRAYIDARGLKQGGYLVGDEWMRKSYDMLWESGFEVEKDESPLVLRKSYPMTDAAYYLGWYSGPSGPFVRDGGFQMLPGAVAYHIISNSAITLRPPFESRSSWVIKFIESGAAVTMGAVSEPFLTMTSLLDVFTDRLLAGYTFGEAAYQSTPTISWQMTMIGDPLYRPFRDDANKQLALAKETGLDTTWPSIRCLNLLFRAGKESEALDLCRTLQRESAGRSQKVYEEKAAQFLLEMKRYDDARREWTRLAKQTEDADLARRAYLRLWQLGELQNDALARFEAMNECMRRFPEDDFGKVWLERMVKLAEEYGTSEQLQYYEERIASLEEAG